MSNYFTAELTRMFEEIESKFTDGAVQRYRLLAQSQFKAWETELNGPPPTDIWRAAQQPIYVLHSPPDRTYRSPKFEIQAADFKAGYYKANFELSKEDALREVANAKRHFVNKQSEKLANATKLCTGKPVIAGMLQCSGVVTGHLDVRFKKKSSFRLAMNLIWNYRRGRSYIQFPSRFTDVLIGGVKPKAVLSEAWMGANFQ